MSVAVLQRIRRLKKSIVLALLSIAVFGWVVACSGAPRQSTLSASDRPAIANAAVRADLGLAVGTNLAGIADWSTQLPFIDAFKSARQWIPQCAAEEPGCSGGWGIDGEQLELDEQGWVKSLPAPEDPPEHTRAGTLLYREIQGRYPGGQYVVLYEGEGTIEYSFDAQKDAAASTPGRDVINVTPSDAGIYLIITATDPNKTGDYIRNIHVVPIASETTFETEIFNPAFIEKVQKFQAFRFMDWMSTNNSEQSEWSNRPTIDDATYARKGVPIEIMVELANRLGADPWFCMPHRATDEYITNFAQLVKDTLDPTLKAYVEYSNEVWNWQFQQANYALEQGKSLWGQEGDAYMQWYGMRSAQVSDLWKQVFADQPERVVSILSTQTSWLGLENAALDCPLWVAEGNTPCYQHGIDAFAISGYFGGNFSTPDNIAAVESWTTESENGFTNAIAQLKEGTLLPAEGHDDSLPGIKKSFDYHQKVAQDRNLKLVVYEGGQHLTSPDNEALSEFFIELNRRPEMYDLYTQLLEQWQAAGGGLFMNFSDVGQFSRWGSWGLLEYVDQDGSPKYDAVMDFIEQL